MVTQDTLGSRLAARERTQDEVHRLLGRLIHAYARLDLNMGLQLKWLGPYRGVPIDHLLDKRVPLAHRFCALRPLVLEVYATDGVDASRSFSQWFDRADEAKALRNDYAHGRWLFDTADECADPHFDFVALSWEMDPAKQDPPLRLSLTQFRRQVEEMELLSGEFFKLESKFRDRCLPPIAYQKHSERK